MAGVTLVAQPPGGQVAEGEGLVLSCTAGGGTRPLVFSWHREGRAQPLAQGPRYELPAARPEDGGHYLCRATDGVTTANSSLLQVTVVGEHRAGWGGTLTGPPVTPRRCPLSQCPWPVPPCGWRGRRRR